MNTAIDQLDCFTQDILGQIDDGYLQKLSFPESLLLSGSFKSCLALK